MVMILSILMALNDLIGLTLRLRSFQFLTKISSVVVHVVEKCPCKTVLSTKKEGDLKGFTHAAI